MLMFGEIKYVWFGSQHEYNILSDFYVIPDVIPISYLLQNVILKKSLVFYGF